MYFLIKYILYFDPLRGPVIGTVRTLAKLSWRGIIVYISLITADSFGHDIAKYLQFDWDEVAYHIIQDWN